MFKRRKNQLATRWMKPNEAFESSFGLVTCYEFCEKLRESLNRKKGIATEIVLDEIKKKVALKYV